MVKIVQGLISTYHRWMGMGQIEHQLTSVDKVECKDISIEMEKWARKNQFL